MICLFINTSYSYNVMLNIYYLTSGNYMKLNYHTSGNAFDSHTKSPTLSEN